MICIVKHKAAILTQKKTLTLEPSTAHRTYGPGPTPVQNAADKGYDNDILNIFKPSF